MKVFIGDAGIHRNDLHNTSPRRRGVACVEPLDSTESVRGGEHERRITRSTIRITLSTVAREMNLGDRSASTHRGKDRRALTDGDTPELKRSIPAVRTLPVQRALDPIELIDPAGEKPTHLEIVEPFRPG